MKQAIYILIGLLVVFLAVYFSKHPLTFHSKQQPDTLIVKWPAHSPGLTPIYQVQGNHDASPLAGEMIATSGVVTADWQGKEALSGFFMQSLQGDGDSLTSDGIFVYEQKMDVEVGEHIQVYGRVKEYHGLTELTEVTGLKKMGEVDLPKAVKLHFPLDDQRKLEDVEGMKVRLSHPMTVTDVYQLGRYGQVTLSAEGRLLQPTQTIDPNDMDATGHTFHGQSNIEAIQAQQGHHQAMTLLLDDASNQQNPKPVPYLDKQHGTLRAGSQMNHLEGVITFSHGHYRLHPTQAPDIEYAPRPKQVPGVGSPQLTIASFNVGNYFTTLDDGQNGARGAGSPEEQKRQRKKLAQALNQMDADIVGLIEMENHPENEALIDLTHYLNKLSEREYQWINDPHPGWTKDRIKVSLIYKENVCRPIGQPLTSDKAIFNRAPLAQAFHYEGDTFTVVVNHLKSKSCYKAQEENKDQGDGQGCYNHRRKLQAQALITLIDGIEVQTGNQKILAIGDFNAYAQEDPMDILRYHGMVDLAKGQNSYSYGYKGWYGSLDHAFATPSLSDLVTGMATWHINADEPPLLDYNMADKNEGYYQPNAFRSSDHDPLLIGLFATSRRN